VAVGVGVLIVNTNRGRREPLLPAQLAEAPFPAQLGEAPGYGGVTGRPRVHVSPAAGARPGDVARPFPVAPLEGEDGRWRASELLHGKNRDVDVGGPQAVGPAAPRGRGAGVVPVAHGDGDDRRGGHCRARRGHTRPSASPAARARDDSGRPSGRCVEYRRVLDVLGDTCHDDASFSCPPRLAVGSWSRQGAPETLRRGNGEVTVLLTGRNGGRTPRVWTSLCWVLSRWTETLRSWGLAIG
jgi:hypothetical protein